MGEQINWLSLRQFQVGARRLVRNCWSLFVISKSNSGVAQKSGKFVIVRHNLILGPDLQKAHNKWQFARER